MRAAVRGRTGFLEDLEAIAYEARERTVRAQEAADRIRERGGFREVKVLDVLPDGMAVLATSGEAPAGEGHDRAVIPVLSLSREVVGAIEVRSDPAHSLSDTSILRLEACAAVLWWLWSDR